MFKKSGENTEPCGMLQSGCGLDLSFPVKIDLDLPWRKETDQCKTVPPNPHSWSKYIPWSMVSKAERPRRARMIALPHPTLTKDNQQAGSMLFSSHNRTESWLKWVQIIFSARTLWSCQATTFSITFPRKGRLQTGQKADGIKWWLFKEGANQGLLKRP